MSTSYLSERSGLPYSCKLGKNFVPDAILVIEDYSKLNRLNRDCHLRATLLVRRCNFVTTLVLMVYL